MCIFVRLYAYQRRTRPFSRTARYMLRHHSNKMTDSKRQSIRFYIVLYCRIYFLLLGIDEMIFFKSVLMKK